MNDYYVYILKCSDGSYYTGVTNNIERRVGEHNIGVDSKCYTYTRRPVECVYCTMFSQVEDAIKAEKQVKGWSRAKKEALIKNNIDELKRLSNKHGSSSSP